MEYQVLVVLQGSLGTALSLMLNIDHNCSRAFKYNDIVLVIIILLSASSYFPVQQEITERRQFLQDMEAVGQAEKHRPVIETQISQVSRSST